MHFELPQIRSQELIREVDEYRLVQQAKGPGKLPEVGQPAPRNRLHVVCWPGSADERSRCLRLSGTPTTDPSH